MVFMLETAVEDWPPVAAHTGSRAIEIFNRVRRNTDET